MPVERGLIGRSKRSSITFFNAPSSQEPGPSQRSTVNIEEIHEPTFHPVPSMLPTNARRSADDDDGTSRGAAPPPTTRKLQVVTPKGSLYIDLPPGEYGCKTYRAGEDNPPDAHAIGSHESPSSQEPAEGISDAAPTTEVHDVPQVDATEIAPRWLADTGASRDMTDGPAAQRYPNSIVQVPAVHLHTANGVVTSDQALSFNVRQLGDAPGLARVMKSTPHALAVGRRVMEQGFGYHWVSGKFPFFFTPDGRVAVLREIRHTCPYVSNQTTLHSHDDPEIDDLCGVFFAEIDDKGPCMCFPINDDQQGAAPGVASSGGVGELDAQPADTDRGGDGSGGDDLELSDEQIDDLPLDQLPKLSVHNPYTHLPADPKNCFTCRLAKMRNLRKETGHEARPTTKFGQHVTAYHKIHSDFWKLPSVGGRTAALNVLDLHTRFRGNYPFIGLSANETAYCLAQFRGTDEIRLLYSDKSEIIGAAAKQLSIPWEHAQPGMPQTNSIIERANGDIISGTRAQLCQAGLPDCFWHLAGPCYTLLENISLGADGTSAWSPRTGSHWKARIFPFRL